MAVLLFILSWSQIVLTDVNEHTPVFQSTPYAVTVGENEASGFLAITIAATDADIGQNGIVTYAITAGNTGLCR